MLCQHSSCDGEDIACCCFVYFPLEEDEHRQQPWPSIEDFAKVLRWAADLEARNLASEYRDPQMLASLCMTLFATFRE
jgi:hypothetical protein